MLAKQLSIEAAARRNRLCVQPLTHAGGDKIILINLMTFWTTNANKSKRPFSLLLRLTSKEQIKFPSDSLNQFSLHCSRSGEVAHHRGHTHTRPHPHLTTPHTPRWSSGRTRPFLRRWAASHRHRWTRMQQFPRVSLLVQWVQTIGSWLCVCAWVVCAWVCV